VAARLVFAQRRVLQLSSGDLRRQLSTLLLDEGPEGVVELSQQSLAALLGATRSAVNRVLRELERDGLVSLGYGRIDIIDAERLGEKGLRR
jgi:CRP-like cAMP-binding protein